MLIAAGVTVLDVLMRWLAGTAITALNEITALIFAVAVAACMPAGLAGGVNLRIDLLARWLTGRVAAWLDVLGAALLLVFFFILAWRIGVFAENLLQQGRTTVILRLPQAPFMYAVAILLAIGTLVQAVVTARAGARAFRHEGAESPVIVAIALVLGAATLALCAILLFDFAAAAHWASQHIGAAVAIAFIFMWILMFAQVPLAAVMGVTGIVGSALFVGLTPATSAFATEATTFLTNSQVATLPLFLMMGSFAAVSGMSDDMYRLGHVLLSRYRGGLALATIGGCAGFGALTGSSLATAATIGRVAIPEMRARGYSPALATGCCAAGGTLGPIVPPGSGPIIVFALLTEASIGQLFVASVGPAVLTILFYFATVMLYVRLAPGAAPPTRTRDPGELGATARQCVPVGILFALVMGGLYFGIFTDTESAAVGAFGAFLFAAWRGKLGRGAFWAVMAETTATTAMIYALIFGAQIFSFFVGVSTLTQSATAWVGSLDLSPLAVMAVILLGYLALGSLMEAFAVMVITVPIVTPLVLSLGFDLVWWGIIMLIVVEVGMIHPPLGLNVFVLKSITPDVPLWTIYRGVLPFCAADLIKLVLLVLIPAITLWLPGTMGR
ncbi:MAG TPA: TRAP transporter large permease subunit [Xanthobacteraceae bacterium]|nr:TRAP transporter large permease subunit [Xanthobacteraceae bacterium]